MDKAQTPSAAPAPTTPSFTPRSKEIIFAILELLRQEVGRQFSDWKDADDWIFSNLNMTRAEVEVIYEGSNKMVYMTTCIPDHTDDDCV